MVKSSINDHAMYGIAVTFETGKHIRVKTDVMLLDSKMHCSISGSKLSVDGASGACYGFCAQYFIHAIINLAIAISEEDKNHVTLF